MHIISVLKSFLLPRLGSGVVWGWVLWAGLTCQGNLYASAAFEHIEYEEFDAYAAALERQQGRIAGTSELISFAEKRCHTYKKFWDAAHKLTRKSEAYTPMDVAWFQGFTEEYQGLWGLWRNRLYELRLAHPELPLKVDMSFEDPYTRAVGRQTFITWDSVIVMHCLDQLNLLERGINYLQTAPVSHLSKKYRLMVNHMIKERYERQIFWRERLKRATSGSVIYKALVQPLEEVSLPSKVVTKPHLQDIKAADILPKSRARSASMSVTPYLEQKKKTGRKAVTPR